MRHPRVVETVRESLTAVLKLMLLGVVLLRYKSLRGRELLEESLSWLGAFNGCHDSMEKLLMGSILGMGAT